MLCIEYVTMFCYYSRRALALQKGNREMNNISINGHTIGGTLLVDDPGIKRAVTDPSGQLRHVRGFSHPGRLKSYLRKHPEGIILAGVGSFFFIEPVPVSSAMIRFDGQDSAEILIRDETYQIEKQLSAMEKIWDAASEQLRRL